MTCPTTCPTWAETDRAALPATQRLGERLFAEKRFTNPASSFAASCSSCHRPPWAPEGGRAYSDSIRYSLMPTDSRGRKSTTLRNTPSLMDAAAHTRFYHDGRFTSLRAAITAELTSPHLGWLESEREQALDEIRDVLLSDGGVDRIADGTYVEQFKRAYDVDLTAMSRDKTVGWVVKCLTDYVAQLRSTRTSAFDAFLRRNRLPSAPAKGQSVEAFARSLLARVDRLERGRALKTDNRFSSKELEGLKVFLGNASEAGASSCVSCHPPPLFTDGTLHDGFAPGAGAIKTPTLRNLGSTDPYLHNGAHRTLEEAVKQKLPAFASEDDVAPLVAFLTTLDDLRPADSLVARGSSTLEKSTRVHRLASTKRAAYDAFAYVNRIPESADEGESAHDLAGRIVGRLANQEGRILLKLPPGMDKSAYLGFKTFLRYEGETKVGNCVACHPPPEFTDSRSHVVAKGRAPTKTSTLRNPATRKMDLRRTILDKIRASQKKQSGDADEIAAPYARMIISKKDIPELVAFLRLLEDVPDTEFRKLILNAQVLDTSNIRQ